MQESGVWFYREGIAKTYEGFAKVLENHLDAPLADLEDAAAHYIEMLRGPLFMKALCQPDFKPTDDDIEAESKRAADIMCTWLKAKWSMREEA